MTYAYVRFLYKNIKYAYITANKISFKVSIACFVYFSLF